MLQLIRRRALLALLLASASLSGLAQANETTAGALVISEGWSRAAGQGRTGAGFLTIRNTGSAPDRLLAARTTAAAAVELHAHHHDNGVMRMREVATLDIPPGQSVVLQPGGLHLMLLRLTDELRQGRKVEVTLVFERAGEATVTLSVGSAGARGPGTAHAH